MKRRLIFSLIGALAGSLLHINADVNSSTKNNSYMIPTGRLVLAPDDLAEDIAISSLLEFGPRNARVGGTVAFQLDSWNRFKLSGEYLGQKLNYSYSTGSVSRWMQQSAIGVDYQTIVDKDCLRAIDFSLYSSYAPSKKLSTKTARVGGNRIQRRIAGSTAWGAEIGTVWTLGEEDLFNVDLEWDHVRYKRKFERRKTVSGLGASLAYTHRFPCCIDLTLEGQFRRPFNYLGAKIDWASAFDNPQLALGVFGGHTRGKMNLPSSSIVGIELNYIFAMCQPRPRDCCAPLWNPCDIVAWSMVPAVYMPEVLAIAEERTLCNAPTSQAIPNQGYVYFIPLTYSMAPFFFSSQGNLVFSLSGNDNIPGVNMTIDPITGEISLFAITVAPETFSVTVTGTDSCGSTSQPLTFRFGLG